MAAVLLMVGKGQEEPEVVLELLDVEKNSQKPQYNMAPEVRPNCQHHVKMMSGVFPCSKAS